MRLLRVAIPVSFLFLATACGGSTPTTTPAGPSPAPTSASPSSSAGGPSSSAGGPSSSAGGQVLTGVLEPTAFTIFLRDATGAPVTTLKAGTYQVKIKDPSTIHNFHLTGTGVDEKTEVAATVDAEWTVTFVPSTYTYVCDPHPSNMKKTFTVT